MVEEREGVVVLLLEAPLLQKGIADTVLTREVRNIAQSREHPQILVNLALCIRIDSFGVSQLVECHQLITRVGGQLKICKAKTEIRKMISLMIPGLIEEFDTEAEALASFRRQQS